MKRVGGGRGCTGCRDPVDWFVRRAGVARCTTFACAAGLSLTAMIGGRTRLALGGLVGSLLVAVAMAALRRRDGGRGAGPGGSARSRPAVAASWLLAVSVLLIGLSSGFLLGSVRLAALLHSEAEAYIGKPVEAELVVTGAVRSFGGWQSAAAVIRKVEVSRRDGGAAGERVLLEAPPAGDSTGGASARGEAPSLAQGAIVSFSGTIEAPRGPSDSGYDERRTLLHQGIKVVFSARSAGSVVILGWRGGAAGWFDRLRASARQHLSLGPNARVDEVLQGVVMGDTAGIDQDWLVAFRRSGTAHMLSVSGLHVASLAAIMMGLARLLRAPRWVGFLLAAAAAVLIVPFVGSSPPVLRSAVMIVLVLAGRWVGRGRDQWQVLALAAVVVLAMNPFGLFDVGFQLSFAAFVGMLLLLGPLERLLALLPEAIRSNVAVSLAATAGTAPVALATFGATSLVSPIANLLVVPTLPLVTGVGMAGVFLGFLSGGLGRALDAVASVPMSWTILVARLMSRAPVLTAADLGRAAVAVIAGAAVLPLALALLGRRAPLPFGLRLPFFQRSVGWTRAHRPRGRRRALGLAVGVVLGGLLMGVAVYPALAGAAEKVHIVAGSRGWPTGVELRVLDIGQGNAVLLRTPQHHAALFDGGPAGCRLAAQLHALGVERLDLVVVSHPHADHFAGLLEALDGIEVDAFVDDVDLESPGAAAARAAPAAGAKPGASQTAVGGEDQASAGEAAEYLRLRHELAHEGAAYARAATGFSLRLDGATIHFFAPASPTVLVDGPAPWSARGEEPSGDELNGSSLVAFVTVGTVDMLLPGDAEADVLQRYRLPPAEVLVVPHHGSRGGVTSDLLQQLGTRAAFISVGAGNPFGHPAPATLATLREAVGCVLRTDKSGWVSCTVQGDQMTISAEHMPVTDTQRTQATR